MSGSDWSGLVGSRLCHDLVSPLGAIGNGVELLQMLLPASPELDLVAQSVAATSARVQLFRLAFGVTATDQDVPAADLDRALAGLGARVACRVDLPGPLPRPLARRLTLAALCAETALCWGGTLSVQGDSVTARAERLRLDPALWGPLAAGQPPAHPVPSTVQFALLAGSGATAVTSGEGWLTIRV